VPIGAGHFKAASAVKQAFESLTDRAMVRLEDAFKWCWPVYGKGYKIIYEFGQKYSNAVLLFWYKGTGIKGSDRKFYLWHKFTAYKISRLLDEFRPDYVLCVHWSPAYYAAIFKKRFGYRIGVVITDYYIHQHWVNNEVDDFFIPHEYLADQIMGYGVRKEKLHPLGIPINLAMEGIIDKASARKRFNISEKKICATVMGSRVFGGEWYEIVREIVDFDYDLLVLCGDNKEAMSKIKQLKGRSKLSVYGMVDKIQELIAVTDILITKAGGITTTEATRTGPALLFANSIIGLEDKNEEFFIKHGAATNLTKENARKVVSDLLVNPKKIAAMKENLLKIGKRDSARNIAKTILRL